MLLFSYPRFFRSPDGGGGGGAGNAPGNDDPENQGNPNSSGDGEDKGGDGKGKDPNAGKVTFTPEQQTEVNRIIQERIERDRKAREKESQKAADDAEAQRLAEQNQFKELAEKRETKIKELEVQISELEPLKETVTKYEAALQKFLDAEKKDLPAHILTLLEKLDVVDQLEYIATNRESLKAKSKDGPPPTPKDGDAKTLSEKEKETAKANADTFYGSLFH